MFIPHASVRQLARLIVILILRSDEMEVALLHEFNCKINYILCLYRGRLNCTVLWANTDVSEGNPANTFFLKYCDMWTHCKVTAV
jgi:hypothetical protein